MRNKSLKGMLSAYSKKKSPLRNEKIVIAPSSTRRKNYTGSEGKYSTESTKDTFGAKLISSITPKNTVGGILSSIGGGALIKNAPKVFKAAKMFIGGRN